VSAIDSEPGLVESFSGAGAEARLEAVLRDLDALGVRRLRVIVGWSDWAKDERLHHAILSRLSARLDVVPCLLTQGAPAASDPTAFADWIEHVVGPHARIGTVELADDPAAEPIHAWRARIGAAACWMAGRGRRVVLGGPGGSDRNALASLSEAGVLGFFDAVGLTLSPDRPGWNGWDAPVQAARATLETLGSAAEVWITDAGVDARFDPARTVRALCGALRAGADRVYWRRLRDVSETAGDGLRRADGTWSLAGRLWADEGLDGLLLHEQVTLARRPRPEKYALITGGAGFVGSNLAHRLAEDGHRVVVLDDLSRPGVERNAAWLQDTHGDDVVIEVGDVRDAEKVRELVNGADQVFHLAAQVAVTSSLVNPTHDFEVNARGALHVLEALRRRDDPPPALFTSTNKVYGGLEDVAMRRTGLRHEPVDDTIRERGISEARPLDFHSPYGCSKGAADQYFVDYARTFGLPAVVFRMSCIYGPRQFGTEDQGWVAHFLMRALDGLPITVYGDGLQVRDALFVDDLIDAMLLVRDRAKELSGQAFNVGGGPDSTLSLVELLGWIEKLQSTRPLVSFEGWRPGDQRWYVSDTRKLREATGWAPQVGVAEGLRRLDEWLRFARDAVGFPAAAAAQGSRG
jgi:CDP-paratose 2-epimerase